MARETTSARVAGGRRGLGRRGEAAPVTIRSRLSSLRAWIGVLGAADVASGGVAEPSMLVLLVGLTTVVSFSSFLRPSLMPVARASGGVAPSGVSRRTRAPRARPVRGGGALTEPARHRPLLWWPLLGLARRPPAARRRARVARRQRRRDDEAVGARARPQLEQLLVRKEVDVVGRVDRLRHACRSARKTAPSAPELSSGRPRCDASNAP